MTPESKDILRLIDEIKREEYQRGWNDAFASVLEAARKGVATPDHQPNTLTETPPATQEEGPSIITLVYEGIKSRPGRKGHLILKDVAAQTGIDFKKVDRTGRTSLSRLKKRGKIVQRGPRWYPAEEAEKETPAVGSPAP